MWLYGVTVLTGALLLFLVQPLLGKWILPWFGGGPAVWAACMLFFQALLLAGYAWAHLLRWRLALGRQVLLHAAALAAAAVVLPLAPAEAWKPAPGDNPTLGVLMLLAVTVGPAYVVLAATSPLLQAWWSVARPGKSPYRLYALSNAGSLAALVAYPFLMEPLAGLRVQAGLWSAGFAAFIVLCAGCGLWVWLARRGAAADAPATDAPAPDAGVPGSSGTFPGLSFRASEASREISPCQGILPNPPDAHEAPPAAWVDDASPGLAVRLLWLALPACGSVLLLAVTNVMCADAGSLPLLWVLPLAIYLLTFILCFESDRVYRRWIFWPLVAGAFWLVLYLLDENVEIPLAKQAAGYGAALFAACMVCHGELVRLRPSPRRLTGFYLSVAAGGAAGGVLVAVVAPMFLAGYFELHLGLWACAALALAALARDLRRRLRRRTVTVSLVVISATVLAAAGVALKTDIDRQTRRAVASARNFYGVMAVTRDDGEFSELGMCTTLRHGSILHGSQYAEEPVRRQPITYYGPQSGLGVAIESCRAYGGPVRIGVVGLGTGTIAAWGRAGDTVRFYEINPLIEHLARTYFTYLADSEADVRVALGDARLSLETEPPQGFDVLALDAFTGDAVPLHLLTLEAFQIYMRHLSPRGVLAVHISNRFLDFKPVVLAAARHAGWGALLVDSDDGGREELSESTWMLVARDPVRLHDFDIQKAATPIEVRDDDLRLWTDDYSDLFSVLKLR